MHPQQRNNSRTFSMQLESYQAKHIPKHYHVLPPNNIQPREILGCCFGILQVRVTTFDLDPKIEQF